MQPDVMTQDQLHDDAIARMTLRRARAVVGEVCGELPAEVVAVVFRQLADLAADRAYIRRDNAMIDAALDGPERAH